ncbi:hypothetical protein GCM10009608_79740 [Pseudonocardia alaniniphila]
MPLNSSPKGGEKRREIIYLGGAVMRQSDAQRFHAGFGHRRAVSGRGSHGQRPQIEVIRVAEQAVVGGTDLVDDPAEGDGRNAETVSDKDQHVRSMRARRRRRAGRCSPPRA